MKEIIKAENTDKTMEKVSYNIIKEKSGKINQNGFFLFDKEFIEEFFLNDEEMLNANIFAQRIIANIVLSLNSDQFFIKDQDNHQLKLSLFDDEFMGNDNTGMLFKMNSIEICKGGNYQSLKYALNFLESYKRGWYDTVNEKGEKISFLGGLISNPVINRKTGNFQFFITSHWLKKLLNLGYYNKTYYKLVQEISSNKHMIFWYWLAILPENGTIVSYEKINSRFKLNYSSARDLCKGFLKPIKANFDKFAHTSFNYSYNGHLINITKYRLNPESLELNQEIKQSSVDELKKQYKISYLSRRHKLTERQIGSIKQFIQFNPVIFVDSYKHFISNCRKNKIKASDFTQDDFINEFQNCIKEIYLNTSTGKIYPNAYPKITN